MSAQQNIYDFENNLPRVFSAVATDNGMTPYTPESNPELQNKTPRLEIVFVPGSAIQPVRIALTPKGTQVVSAYHGELKLRVVTFSTDKAKQDHSAYRANTRAAFELGVIIPVINQIPSVYALHWIIPSGSGQTQKYQDGYEVTDLSYSIDFSIQADAWAQLNI